MNPQQKEFDTALAGLTPEQRATYIKANPTVGVGGVQQSVNDGTYQPIPKAITTGDINNTQNLIPVAPKAPLQTPNPIVTAPTGTTIGTDGTATYTPPPPPQPVPVKEKNTYQKALEAIGLDIGQLEKKPEVTKQVQEQQQLAQKTEQATKDYNAYNLKKRELETKIREMQTAEANQVGGVGGGYSSTIQEYTRKANAELADLAIQAQASQGLLDSARQTIKDTLEAQFSPIEDRIARRTQYAQLAANDLTESEKYKLDQLNKKDEANQKEVSTYAANLANTVFENGAPVGVRTKIFNIAGDYASGKITKEQAQAKMMEAAGNYGVKATTATEKAPTIQKINGVDMQWNPTSGKWETPTTLTSGTTSASTMPLAQSKANVDQITELSGNIVSSAVGTSAFTRSQPGFWTNLGKIATIVGAPQAILGTYQRLTGEQQNFIAGVEQLRSNLNLDTLINAKARGATFGALSDQELQVLSNAATKLGSWAVKNSEGQTVGFNTTEANLKKELEKINNFARLDYIIKGGDPMDVNAQMQSDGSIWVKNSDGTLTQIK